MSATRFTTCDCCGANARCSAVSVYFLCCKCQKSASAVNVVVL